MLKQRRVSPGRLLGLVGVLALEIYVVVCAFLALSLTRPKPVELAVSPADYGVAFEEVRFAARDGVEIAGWFLPGKERERAVILMPGMGSCRRCQGTLPLAVDLQAEGLAVLMLDPRAHGDSEGEFYSLGEYERLDVLGAVAWLHERGVDRIGVLGISQGAAAAVGAATEARGEDGIRALVLDSGFGHAPALLEQAFGPVMGMPLFFLPGTLWMAEKLVGVHPETVHPATWLAQVEAPILLIYGAQDHLVTRDQFEALVTARPDALQWVVDGVPHASIYEYHPDLYVTRVAGFFREALGE